MNVPVTHAETEQHAWTRLVITCVNVNQDSLASTVKNVSKMFRKQWPWI